MTADRKQEIREKFLLGAIVVKAGLSKADRAFLLGGLLELAEVATDSPEYRRLRDIGEKAFMAPSPNCEGASVEEMVEWH